MTEQPSFASSEGFPDTVVPIPMDPARNRAILGGLQAHSVGGIYPLLVMGYAYDDEYRVYQIRNLQKGTLAVYPRTFVPIEFEGTLAGYNAAHEWAENHLTYPQQPDWIKA